MFYNYQNELKNLNNFVECLKNYSHEVTVFEFSQTHRSKGL